MEKCDELVAHAHGHGSFAQARKKFQRVRRELGLDETARLLLFCGTLDERKGLPELTVAWHEFAAAYPDWQLVMVGRATEQHLAERLKEKGHGRVIFTGHVPQQQVLSYFQAADAYIQPSRLEGLANATMEAAAVGLPIITTDTCGQREVIQSGVNGWLVAPENPSALLAALQELAADEARAQKYGQAARDTIKQDFNPTTQAQELAGILRQYSLRRTVNQTLTVAH